MNTWQVTIAGYQFSVRDLTGLGALGKVTSAHPELYGKPYKLACTHRVTWGA
jgi:hypothetical protein